MLSLFNSFGVCMPGSAGKIFQNTDPSGYGPLLVSIQQQDYVDFMVGCLVADANGDFTVPVTSFVGATAQETVRTAAASGWVGNGVLLAFACTPGGNGDFHFIFTITAANPVIPGTVLVHPTVMGTSDDARDYLGNGILYTATSRTACGTINYETGQCNMSYPTGMAPGAGNINVSCYSSLFVTTRGNHVRTFGGQPMRDQAVRMIGMSRPSVGLSCRLAVGMVFGS